MVDDFPVLWAGPTPRTPLDTWSFTIQGAVDRHVSWACDELRALPSETFTVDIHRVTKWSKLETSWGEVSLDRLLGVETEAEYVTAWSEGGSPTNPPLQDLTGGRAWVAHEYGSEPPEAEAWPAGAHAGPAPVLLEEREVVLRCPVRGDVALQITSLQDRQVLRFAGTWCVEIHRAAQWARATPAADGAP